MGGNRDHCSAAPMSSESLAFRLLGCRRGWCAAQTCPPRPSLSGLQAPSFWGAAFSIRELPHPGLSPPGDSLHLMPSDRLGKRACPSPQLGPALPSARGLITVQGHPLPCPASLLSLQALSRTHSPISHLYSNSQTTGLKNHSRQPGPAQVNSKPLTYLHA